MYLAHFGLKRKPFDISPDPEFLWLGEKHREGLAILKYGILENKGFLLITGNVGTGKTALIRAIEKEIEARAIVVSIPDPGMSLMDFYNFMASELKMDRHFTHKGEFLIHFKRLILNAFSSYQRVLLIIDESQRLNHELLEEIRLLSNIDLAGRVLINIFFVGQTEFRDILAQEENRAVRQRITVSYHIPPLTEAEVRDYIAHRLKVAGASQEIFSPEALAAVYRSSQGYPRLINIICDHALMSAYSRGLERIDKDTIRECSEELKITIGAVLPERPAPPPAPAQTQPVALPIPEQRNRPARSRRGAFILACCVLLFALGWYFFGDSISDELARLGSGRQLAATPSQGAAGERIDRAPPLPVETGPREPKAEPPAESGPTPGSPAKAPQAAVPAQPPKGDAGSPPTAGAGASQPASRPTQASAPPAPASAAAPAQTEAPPAAAAPPAASQPAAPASPTAPVVGSVSTKPFQLKEFIVYFTINSTEIPVYANDILSTAAVLMKANPETRAVIEGHSDSVGDPVYNRLVSENRAAAVRDFLSRQGIDAPRMTAAGFGSEKPMDSNDTPEGRSKNRRVVIRIVPGRQG